MPVRDTGRSSSSPSSKATSAKHTWLACLNLASLGIVLALVLSLAHLAALPRDLSSFARTWEHPFARTLFQPQPAPDASERSKGHGRGVPVEFQPGRACRSEAAMEEYQDRMELLWNEADSEPGGDFRIPLTLLPTAERSRQSTRGEQQPGEGETGQARGHVDGRFGAAESEDSSLQSLFTKEWGDGEGRGSVEAEQTQNRVDRRSEVGETKFKDRGDVGGLGSNPVSRMLKTGQSIQNRNENRKSSFQPIQNKASKTSFESMQNEPGTCLDGSPPAFHLSPGRGLGATKWVVYLQGQGWCTDKDSCSERARGPWGSSRLMQAQGSSDVEMESSVESGGILSNSSGAVEFGGILSNSSRVNPFFFDWNRVLIRDCTGDLFSGEGAASDAETKDSSADAPSLGPPQSPGTPKGASLPPPGTPKGRLPPSPVSPRGRGRLVFLSVIRHLMEHRGLGAATHVLLGGYEAGGLAALLLCDGFRELMDEQGGGRVGLGATPGQPSSSSITMAGDPSLSTSPGEAAKSGVTPVHLLPSAAAPAAGAAGSGPAPGPAPSTNERSGPAAGVASSTTQRPPVVVKCLADSGLFMDSKDTFGDEILRPAFAALELFHRPRLIPACVAAHKGKDEQKSMAAQPEHERWDETQRDGLCLFPARFLPFVGTPVFLVNSLYDNATLWRVVPPGHGYWAQCVRDLRRCRPNQLEYFNTFRTAMVDMVANLSFPHWRQGASDKNHQRVDLAQLEKHSQDSTTGGILFQNGAGDPDPHLADGQSSSSSSRSSSRKAAVVSSDPEQGGAGHATAAAAAGAAPAHSPESPHVGAFLYSCRTRAPAHVSRSWHGPEAPRLHGRTMAEAVGNWFYECLLEPAHFDCAIRCDQPACQAWW